MKTQAKRFSLVSTMLCAMLFASVGRADFITALNSGNWSDPTVWDSGTVPGEDDQVDVPFGVDVTVDTNVVVQFITDAGTVTMGTNSTLNVTVDQAIDTTTILDTSAASNTVIYSANPFGAKRTNYYNLVFADTNFVPNPFQPYLDFNNFSVPPGPVDMTIAGDMTVGGATHVLLGASFTVEGDLIIGTNCLWDCSAGVLTVAGNTFVDGVLTDGSGGTTNLNDSFNNLTVGTNAPGLNQTNGIWDLSDVIEWAVAGNLTNNGVIKEHSGPSNGGSITFTGTGVIVGNPFQVSSLFLKGTNTIGATITVTNFLGLQGTVVFDLANPQKLILTADSTNALTYGGALTVVNSGAPPTAGTTYQLFSAPAYGGDFALKSFPPLPGGLTWIDNLATSGSITVSGSAAPVITSFQYNPATRQFTLTWTSQPSATYTVQSTTSLSSSFSTLVANIPSGGSTTTTTVTMPVSNTGFLRILVQ